MPLEALIVGAGAALIAIGLLVVFIPMIVRRDYGDDDPVAEDFTQATVNPWYVTGTVPPYSPGGSRVVPSAATPERPTSPPPLPKPIRPDSETRVLYVVPTLCGCEDGGIRHFTDKSNPWCRRCGGAL